MKTVSTDRAPESPAPAFSPDPTDGQQERGPRGVSIKEAVAVTGLCRSSINKLLRTGDLKSKKILGRRVIPQSEIARLLRVA